MTRIMVLDDSAFQRTFLRGALERSGFEVEDFEPLSSLEVFAKAKDWKPDLVITDYNMPMLTGLDVVRMIRRVDSVLPVIVLTSIRDEKRDAKLRTAGLVEILYKPQPGEAVVEAIRAILPG